VKTLITAETPRRRVCASVGSRLFSASLCLGGEIFALFLLALSLNAQTLQQAEELWKQGRWQDSNKAFQALVAANPKNADYRVRWGRMYLEHSQPGDAADLFTEALELQKDHPGALLGMALVAADNFGSGAGKLAKQALDSDPKLVEAQELLARLALEDSNTPKAIEEARKALAITPNAVQAKAILATIDWLGGKEQSPWDPQAAEGYATAARLFVLNRRYVEGIALYRKALALNPKLWKARSQLGVNLMRLGEDKEAFEQLEMCFNNGFQDAATTNSLRLIESYKNFETFTTPRTIIKLSKNESALLRPYIEGETLRAIATYEKKYKIKLDRPVQIEVYPNHDDFAVRTLGMPGLGALGVTFGYVVAMDSPSGRKPGSFHWASTLWHEMSHVYTLTATGHKVPRWFTEGVAVHEETAANAEWGDRLGPDVLSAIREKKLLPVAELDRGFIHPTNPGQVLVSYFQAGRICDFIAKEWGEDKLLDMLHAFGKGQDTATVVRQQLKIDAAEFDKRFLAVVEAETQRQVDGFEAWRKGLKGLAEMEKKKDFDGIIREGVVIRDLYPDYVEAGSVYETLAAAYTAKKDEKSATAELERYAKMGGRSPETLKRLAKQLEAAGRKRDAAAALERLNFIYPMDDQLHQRLGLLWLDLNNAPAAVREFRAVLAGKPLDAADAHYNLARALRLNKQNDQAKDELIAALEVAPGYRPAQKLLLEMSKQD
jgi:tetratricopeptide (TPR) repeat protein